MKIYSDAFVDLADLSAGYSNYLKLDINMSRNLGLSTCAVWRTLYTAMRRFLSDGKLGEDGFFFYTKNDLEYYSTVKEHQQNVAIEKLVALGLLKKEVRAESFGQRRRFFKIIENIDVLRSICTPVSKEEYAEGKEAELPIQKESGNSRGISSDSRGISSDSLLKSPLYNNETNNQLKHNNNIPIGILTPSVSLEEELKDPLVSTSLVLDSLISEEATNLLFSLENVQPTTKKNKNTVLLDYNNIAVGRFLKKTANKDILPVTEFTATDWLITFVAEYNKVFEKYPLPPMGAAFNGLVSSFSNLLANIPVHYRRGIFSDFLQIVKKGNRMPKIWQNGFLLEQLCSGYNLGNVSAEFQRLLSLQLSGVFDAPEESLQSPASGALSKKEYF